MKIAAVHARQILDSRGNPTIEVDVTLKDGSLGRAAVPSGASTGSHEALELRDNIADQYGGKGVMNAVNNVNGPIAAAVLGMEAGDQQKLDEILRTLDGTPDKSRLGANALLGTSLAVAKAAAVGDKVAFFEHIARLAHNPTPSLPMPMMNILNGGKHAAGSSDIQEFMIIPIGASTFDETLKIGSEVYHSLQSLLRNRKLTTTVGDEGGFAPRLETNLMALDYLMEAISGAGYEPGKDVVIGLDVAASELLHDDQYVFELEPKPFTSEELIEWYKTLTHQYPIVSIEDGLSEDDWQNWRRLNQELGNTVQLVGDDLLVTNTRLLTQAIDEKSANAILIKPNQIGTLTETIEAVAMAKKAGWNTIISHRSGETEDTSIAHLAVGLGAGQIKTGSLARTERTAKYNELLRIAEASNLRLTHPF